MTTLLEQFANGTFSSLNGAITNSATTLVVNSATPYSTVGNFRLLIDTEIVLVTAVSGTTFTITRAQENTTAASHVDGASVDQVPTQGALNQIKIDTRLIVPWMTQTAKTGNYTVLSTDETVPVDTASGVLTITLESAPSDGRVVGVSDVTGNCTKNRVTVSGNGHNIMGWSNYYMQTDWDYPVFHYNSAKTLWVIR